MIFASTIGNIRYTFDSLRELLAKATPLRSGDVLAGIAACSADERVAAQFALADLPLAHFLAEQIVPYEVDEVTRLIVDTHDAEAFAPIRSFHRRRVARLAALRRGHARAAGRARSRAYAGDGRRRKQTDARAGPDCSPPRKSASSRAFAPPLDLPGRLSARLQPNHPTDDSMGIAASILDGLLLGSGDAVIGINPAGDNVDVTIRF